MLRNTVPDPCPVVWPIEQSPEELAVMVGDSLIAQYARPRHTCKLPAEHIGWVRDRNTLDAQGRPQPTMEPHECHCGAWIPVRDVEAAR